MTRQIGSKILQFTQSKYVRHCIVGLLFVVVTATATNLAFGHHQAEIDRQQAMIAEKVEQLSATPMPFHLDQQGQVLGRSLDRRQQYDYLQEHVTNWDTPCFHQALIKAKVYQPQSSAFDYMVAELWTCIE